MKIHAFEALIRFENVLLRPISKNSLQAPSLDYIFFGKFTLSNLIFLVEELIG